MQEKYISLDPEHAETTSALVRSNIYSQRLTEAKGGELSNIVGLNVALTFSSIAYAKLRRNGFRAFPLTPSKAPKLAALALWGWIGLQFGSSYVLTTLGDSKQYHYLKSSEGKNGVW